MISSRKSLIILSFALILFPLRIWSEDISASSIENLMEMWSEYKNSDNEKEILNLLSQDAVIIIEMPSDTGWERFSMDKKQYEYITSTTNREGKKYSYERTKTWISINSESNEAHSVSVVIEHVQDKNEKRCTKNTEEMSFKYYGSDIKIYLIKAVIWPSCLDKSMNTSVLMP